MKKLILSSCLVLILQPLVYANNQGTAAAVTELPKAERTDKHSDLEKSMKKMGRNFKKLRKADNIEEMKKPAQAMAIYASESQAIAEEMANGMKRLRIGIAKLQSAINSGDMAAAKTILKELNKSRKKAHKYFGVGKD